MSINGATDTQQFCYDDLNRLTWSGTSGTPPCSGVSFSAGTLTGAQYQQSDAYNVDGGLISGPGGSYTYGNSSHPHALMATSSGYSAAYDATGNLVCRAPTSSTTCSGTQTGQQLSYDAEGRLSLWQNQPTSLTQIVNYLYDGAGNRVAMMATVNGTTTLTAYIGNLEEVQTTGSTTQTTTYYTVAGQRIAARVNSTLYYFGYDALGSQTLVLNSNGGVVGSQLYGPYGNQRYSTGTLPTSIGFTGQRADSVTGLDYYVARYYDPAVGVFLSPDGKQGNAQGMQPYAYVGGNPETRTDPTGQRYIDGNGNSAWISNGSIYEQQAGSRPTVIGHTKKITITKTPPGGGGGHGHMSAGPPPDLNSPTQSKKTCSQACRVELAQDAANNLQTLMNRTAWGLAILGGLLTLAGGLLQLVAAADDASIFGIPLGLALHALGFALIGFGPMVALIGAEAGFFSSEFSRQAGWGSDKWTTTNIEAFRQQELGYVTFATNVSLLITIALHQAEGFLNNNGKFLSIGAQIGGLVGLLSQNWFKSNINNTVNQEEAVLNPNTIIDCSTVAACS